MPGSGSCYRDGLPIVTTTFVQLQLPSEHGDRPRLAGLKHKQHKEKPMECIATLGILALTGYVCYELGRVVGRREVIGYRA